MTEAGQLSPMPSGPLVQEDGKGHLPLGNTDGAVIPLRYKEVTYHVKITGTVQEGSIPLTETPQPPDSPLDLPDLVLDTQRLNERPDGGVEDVVDTLTAIQFPVEVWELISTARGKWRPFLLHSALTEHLQWWTVNVGQPPPSPEAMLEACTHSRHLVLSDKWWPITSLPTVNMTLDDSMDCPHLHTISSSCEAAFDVMSTGYFHFLSLCPNLLHLLLQPGLPLFGRCRDPDWKNFQYLPQCCPHLQTMNLALQACRDPWPGLLELAKALPQWQGLMSLSLQLSSNSLTEHQLEAFVACLPECRALQSLTVNLGDNRKLGIRQGGLACLATALGQCLQLQTLHLSLATCKLPAGCVAPLGTLCDNLEKLHTLVLNLWGCRLDHTDATALVQLGDCPSLRRLELDLSFTSVCQGAGVSALALLGKCPTLHCLKLKLQRAGVDDHGAVTLARGLGLDSCAPLGCPDSHLAYFFCTSTIASGMPVTGTVTGLE